MMSEITTRMQHDAGKLTTMTQPNGEMWVEWYGRQMSIVSPDQLKNIREVLKADIEYALSTSYGSMAELRESITVYREMEQQVDTVEIPIPPDDAIAEMKRNQLEARLLRSQQAISNIARDAIRRMSDYELKERIANDIANDSDIPF